VVLDLVRASSWTLGGVQLMGSREHPVVGAHVDALVPVADVLGVLLANVQANLQLSAALAQAGGGAQTVATVEQAVGALSGRYRTDVEQARRFLQAQAQHGRVPLAEAAKAARVHRGSAPPPSRSVSVTVTSLIRTSSTFRSWMPRESSSASAGLLPSPSAARSSSAPGALAARL
jgi:hypothetical protein